MTFDHRTTQIHVADLDREIEGLRTERRIGAGSTQFTTADATIAGFLPLGVATLVVIVLQALLGIPRAWRNPVLAFVGLGVSAASIALGLAPKLLGAASADQPSSMKYFGGPFGSLGSNTRIAGRPSTCPVTRCQSLILE